MTTLTLTHTPATGTVLDGTRKGDGTAPVLRDLRLQWRWSDNIGEDGAWYRQNTRDRRPTHPGVRAAVERTAAALREAGFEVAVEIGAERRTVAEQEADRAERAEARVDGLDARAVRLKASGEAGYAAAREYASRIPFGQPILVGHHSEGRHRRDLAKIDRAYDRAFTQLDESEDAAERAKAAAAHQKHRAHGATTMRRLEKLRADLRRAARGMAEPRMSWESEEEYAAKQARRVAHWTPIAEELQEKVTYWEQYLAALAKAGVYRLWNRADFTKGDYVATRHGLMQVLRVNAKSLTIPHILDELAVHGHTWTLPYDEVRGQVSAEEYAAKQAELVAKAEPAG